MEVRTVGRVIGALFLAKMVIAPISNFALQTSLTTPPGFLANAAAHPTELRLAALLSIMIGALWIGIAATALPTLRQLSERAALWFLALAVVMFAGNLVEAIAVRAMLSVSEAYASAGAESEGLFLASAALARSVRNSIHYANLLVSGGAFLVFYGLLFRSTLIPRAVSIFGLAAVAALIVGAVIPLMGMRTVMVLFVPMGLAQLALVSWLLVKGFRIPGGVHARTA